MNKETIKLARWLHETYEDKSRLYKWETQKKCRVDFDDLPLENKKVMLAMALEIDRRIQQERKEIADKIEKKFYEFNDCEQDFQCNQRVLKLRNELLHNLNNK